MDRNVIENKTSPATNVAKSEKNPRASLISRRAALGGGLGVVLASLGPGLVLAPETGPIKDAAQLAASATAPVLEPNLYVFKAPRSQNAVIAVTCSGKDTRFSKHRSARMQVRIHANEKIWRLDAGRTESAIVSTDRGARTFIGEILGGDSAARAGEIQMAAMVETPANIVRRGESMNVWSEILLEDGLRFRAGNPFVAELMARNPLLLERYHATWPDQDLELFEHALAQRVEAMGSYRGIVADPYAHGQRLARRILPDVIRYRPDLPTGFTFASQNGRHPADEVAAVVGTILTGSPKRRPASSLIRLQETFPYFPRNSVLT